MFNKSLTPDISRAGDLAGVVASIACAIHCAAMPFVISYLPALGLGFLADASFHKWMAGVCFLIATIAFLPGLRHHGKWGPVCIGMLGLSMITYAAFGLSDECCAICAEHNAAAYEQQPESTGGAVDELCEHCEDGGHCQFCGYVKTELHGLDSQSFGAETAVSANPNAPSGKKNHMALLAPWITPFGGLVLVGAHLLNHRYGCKCGCCK